VSADGFVSFSESLSESAAWNLHLREGASIVDATVGTNPVTWALVLCFSAWTGATVGSRHLKWSTARFLRNGGRIVSFVDTLLAAIELLPLLRGLSPSRI
jgi:hypothetical protein